MTTTYNLFAVNPIGTSTAYAMVTVNAATSTGTGTDVQTQIQNLLNQIAALKAQILALLQRLPPMAVISQEISLRGTVGTM